MESLCWRGSRGGKHLLGMRYIRLTALLLLVACVGDLGSGPGLTAEDCQRQPYLCTNGPTTQHTTPGLVSGGHTWASINSGPSHTCSVTTAGEAYCWGDNRDGQLGDNSNTDCGLPTLVSGGLTWASVTVGDWHSCGLTTEGEAYCWGFNLRRQLGDGTTTSRAIPVLVSGGDTWASVSSGRSHTCGVTTLGVGYCWGDNQNG